jgi:hypothetical protein
MRVFSCYVVSKLQRHRCLTFGALRFRTQRAFSHLTNGPYTPAPSVGSASNPCFLLYTWRPPVTGPAIPYFAGA